MRTFLYTTIFLLLASSSLFAQEQKPALITWQDIEALPTPAEGKRIAYGTDSVQYGILRLPEGNGPFPVVVVIHGGCWLSDYDLKYMSHLSAALTEAGYATWNLEFRRAGNIGGGWPGTFLDVAKGTDFIKKLAKDYPIDKKQVAVIGHSAGGHLALWLAARENLSRKSFLYTKKPLELKGVVALAGIPDLETYAVETGSCNAAVSKLMGGRPADVPDRYAQASPKRMRTTEVPQILIQGEKDPIVPVTQATSYADHVTVYGGTAEAILLPEAGHFDLVVPTSPAWEKVLQAVHSLFQKSE